jgi:hypothetical protein
MEAMGMRMEIDPADERAFGKLSRRLEDGFGRWAAARSLAVDPFVVELMLDYKGRYLDGHLGCWCAADLDDMLCEWFPRKATVDEQTIGRIVPTVAAFIDYLASSGLLTDVSDPPGQLKATLEKLAPTFRANMRDPSRFGPAKSVATAMLAQGVDLGDKDAVDRFIAQLNAGKLGELDRLLPVLEPVPPPPFPPVRLAPEEELAAAAASSLLVQRLGRFVAWLGEGRRLTQAGNLTVADGKELLGVLGVTEVTDPRTQERLRRVRSSADIAEVGFLTGLAKGAGLARPRRGRLVSTKRGRTLAGQPLEVWEQVLEVLTDLGPLGAAWQGGWRPFWVEFLDRGTRDLLVALYRAGEPVPLDDLAASAWDDVDRAFDLGDDPSKLEGWRSGVARDVGRIVRRLEELGAVQRIGVAEPPSSALGGPTGGAPAAPADGEPGTAARGGVRVALTPLGAWAINRRLREGGAVAPVLGDLVRADVGSLIQRCAQFDPDAATEEIRAWVAARGSGAAAEIAEFARGADDPGDRLLAFKALDVVGPDAAGVARSLRDDPRLRPLATIWLVDHGLEERSALNPRDLGALMVDMAATALDADGPDELVETFQQFGPAEEQATLLGELWRVDNPRTADVLGAVGGFHPDKRVRRAARRAAYKLESAARARPGGQRR